MWKRARKFTRRREAGRPAINGSHKKPATKSTIYVIAGCNGAGKTTFAGEFLPKEVKCRRFLNADESARGLSPFDPGAKAVKAGRLLLAEFRSLVSSKETFAFESTLSGHPYIRLLEDAKQSGFRIHLHYLWLPNPAVAIARVRDRMKKGGHDVPAVDIRRRYKRGLLNLISAFAPLADRWAVWDNFADPPELRATSETCNLAELRLMLWP